MVLLVVPLLRGRINSDVAKSASVALATLRTDPVTSPDGQRLLSRPVSQGRRLTVITFLFHFHKRVPCYSLALICLRSHIRT